MPRLITSLPAARLASVLRASSANRYGGIRSRRRLGRSCLEVDVSGEPTQLLHEVWGEFAGEDGHGPARQAGFEIVCDLDLEFAAVQNDGDRRGTAVEHVSHRGSRRPGAARGRLPHAALEDARADF